MFYRLRRRLNIARFDRQIAGIHKTAPIVVKDAPWCIASMVGDQDVAMYLVALKSFYRRIGAGKVAAIIRRDLDPSLRALLTQHIAGIELVTLEDIDTGECQRGGTWERLIYCVERSQTEYVIQIDADVLAVGDDLVEIVGCIEANRSFVISDGFALASLPEIAKIAQATPSNYIGVVAEAAFDQFPDARHIRYVRGSSGFTGFAKGGFDLKRVSHFHAQMGQLVGKDRWRVWGTEQCGSNFAVANSPDPFVLPYPEYASFTPRVLRRKAKLLHFIGRFRFMDGYYALRAREQIAALAGTTGPGTPGDAGFQANHAKPLLQQLTPRSAARFLAWRVSGAAHALTVQVKPRREFEDDPPPGPQMQLRPRTSDVAVAAAVYGRLHLLPPVWLPPERVLLAVDLQAQSGLAALWFLANYWRARVIAFGSNPDDAAQAEANIALNSWVDRFELHRTTDRSGVGDMLAALQGKHIDIIRIGSGGLAPTIMDRPEFAALDIGAAVLEWDKNSQSGRDECLARLEALGFRAYVGAENGQGGAAWGYRNSDAGLATGLRPAAA